MKGFECAVAVYIISYREMASDLTLSLHLIISFEPAMLTNPSLPNLTWIMLTLVATDSNLLILFW